MNSVYKRFLVILILGLSTSFLGACSGSRFAPKVSKVVPVGETAKWQKKRNAREYDENYIASANAASPRAVRQQAPQLLASSPARQYKGDGKSRKKFKVGSPYKIKGRKYHPKETYDHVETGIASWYGPGFHGKLTANGERYNQNALTAAHRTLQLPSIVRVTNLENGRSMIARVNDRGPFASNRIIDMSKAGAKKLGFIKQGTAKVKVEVLPEESYRVGQMARAGKKTSGMEKAMNKRGYRSPSMYAQNAPAPAPANVAPRANRSANLRENTRYIMSADSPLEAHQQAAAVQKQALTGQGAVSPSIQPITNVTTHSKGNIFIQAASFGDINKAQNYASSLSDIASTDISSKHINGKDFYRVRLGPFADSADANSAVQRLASIGKNDVIVVVD